MKEATKQLSRNQIELMDHTISGHDRNWFATSKGYSDANNFDELVKMGYAIETKAPSWCGSDVLYRLTDEGKNILKTIERPWVKEEKPLTRSQKRYRDYLHSETSETFAEWLGIRK